MHAALGHGGGGGGALPLAFQAASSSLPALPPLPPMPFLPHLISPPANAGAAAAANVSGPAAAVAPPLPPPPPPRPTSVLDFGRIVAAQRRAVASAGLEGRSLAALFSSLERGEAQRRRERALAIGEPTDDTDDSKESVPLDPTMRFHLAKLLADARDLTLFFKQPSAPMPLHGSGAAVPASTTSAAVPAAADVSPSRVLPVVPGVIWQQWTDEEKIAHLQLAAEAQLLQDQTTMQQAAAAPSLYSANVSPAASLAAAAIATLGGSEPLATDQAMLDEALGPSTRPSSWLFTDQGVLHSSSISRLCLSSHHGRGGGAAAMLQALGPDMVHHLRGRLVFVANWRARLCFLGLTEADLEPLRAFAPGGSGGGGGGAAGPVIPPSALGTAGVPRNNSEAPQPSFLVFNTLETIGRFSVHALHRPDAAARAGAAGADLWTRPSSSQQAAGAPSSHGGLQQGALSRILHVSPMNSYRLLLMLEAKGMVVSIKQSDETTSGVQGGGAWRYFLSHLAPSSHASSLAARSSSASFAEAAGIDMAFAHPGGSLVAHTPLQAWQHNVAAIHAFYNARPLARAEELLTSSGPVRRRAGPKTAAGAVGSGATMATSKAGAIKMVYKALRTKLKTEKEREAKRQEVGFHIAALGAANAGGGLAVSGADAGANASALALAALQQAGDGTAGGEDGEEAVVKAEREAGGSAAAAAAAAGDIPARSTLASLIATIPASSSAASMPLLALRSRLGHSSTAVAASSSPSASSASSSVGVGNPGPLFEVGISLPAQMYRALEARGGLGMSTQELRSHFGGHYSNKMLQMQLQVLLKHYGVKSIADQAGKSFAYRFFTAAGYRALVQLHSGGGGAAAGAGGGAVGVDVTALNEHWLATPRGNTGTDAAKARQKQKREEKQKQQRQQKQLQTQQSEDITKMEQVPVPASSALPAQSPPAATAAAASPSPSAAAAMVGRSSPPVDFASAAIAAATGSTGATIVSLGSIAAAAASAAVAINAAATAAASPSSSGVVIPVAASMPALPSFDAAQAVPPAAAGAAPLSSSSSSPALAGGPATAAAVAQPSALSSTDSAAMEADIAAATIDSLQSIPAFAHPNAPTAHVHPRTTADAEAERREKRNPAVQVARSSLRNVQREAMAKEYLLAQPFHMARYMDVSRHITLREHDAAVAHARAAGLPEPLAGRSDMDHSAALRRFNRMAALGTVQLLNVAVARAAGNMRTVTLLVLPDIDLTSEEAKQAALRTARNDKEAVAAADRAAAKGEPADLTREGTVRRRKKPQRTAGSAPSLSGRKRKNITAASDESDSDLSAADKEAGEDALSDVAAEDESKEATADADASSASSDEEEEGDVKPKSASRSRKRQKRIIKEVDDADDDEAGSGGEEDAAMFYHLSHGFVRPRMSRIRLLLERLWTVYSTQLDEGSIEPVAGEKLYEQDESTAIATGPATAAPSSTAQTAAAADEQKQPQASPEAQTDLQRIMAAAAAASAATSIDAAASSSLLFSAGASSRDEAPAGPPTDSADPRALGPLPPGRRAFEYNAFMQGMLLRDWMSIVGVREAEIGGAEAAPAQVAALLAPRFWEKPLRPDNAPALGLGADEDERHMALLTARLRGHNTWTKGQLMQSNLTFARRMGLVVPAKRTDMGKDMAPAAAAKPAQALLEAERASGVVGRGVRLAAPPAVTIGEEYGWFILQPRVRALGRVWDVSTRAGRDRFWNTIRDTALHISRARRALEPPRTRGPHAIPASARKIPLPSYQEAVDALIKRQVLHSNVLMHMAQEEQAKAAQQQQQRPQQQQPQHQDAAHGDMPALEFGFTESASPSPVPEGASPPPPPPPPSASPIPAVQGTIVAPYSDATLPLSPRLSAEGTENHPYRLFIREFRQNQLPVYNVRAWTNGAHLEPGLLERVRQAHTVITPSPADAAAADASAAAAGTAGAGSAAAAGGGGGGEGGTNDADVHMSPLDDLRHTLPLSSDSLDTLSVGISQPRGLVAVEMACMRYPWAAAQARELELFGSDTKELFGSSALAASSSSSAAAAAAMLSDPFAFGGRGGLELDLALESAFATPKPPKKKPGRKPRTEEEKAALKEAKALAVAQACKTRTEESAAKHATAMADAGYSESELAQMILGHASTASSTAQSAQFPGALASPSSSSAPRGRKKKEKLLTLSRKRRRTDGNAVPAHWLAALQQQQGQAGEGAAGQGSDAFSSSEDSDPGPGVTASGRKAVATRRRWSPAEDQRLVALYNEWVMQCYDPWLKNQAAAASAAAALAASGGAGPSASPLAPTTLTVDAATGRPVVVASSAAWDNAAHVNAAVAAHQAQRAPVVSAHQFIAHHLEDDRLPDAVRRRIDFLNKRGRIPSLTTPSGGAAGMPSVAARSIGFTTVIGSVYPLARRVALLSMVKMVLWARGPGTWTPGRAEALVAHHSEHQVDLVLKALRADRWITNTKYSDNAQGRTYKWSAGFMEHLKLQGVANEPFDVAAQEIARWRRDGDSAAAADPSSLDPTRLPSRRVFSVHARGGDLAAVLHLLLSPSSPAAQQLGAAAGVSSGNSSDPAVTLEARDMALSLGLRPDLLLASGGEAGDDDDAKIEARRQQLQKEIEDSKDKGEVDVVDCFPALALSSSLERAELLPEVKAPSSSWSREQLGFLLPSLPWTSLHRVEMPGDDSALLGEEFLMPLQPWEEPAEDEAATTESVDIGANAAAASAQQSAQAESSAMEDMASSSAAAATPATAAISLAVPGAAASTSSKPSEPLASWLDTAVVVSVQAALAKLVLQAGPDGINWSELRKRFLALPATTAETSELNAPVPEGAADIIAAQQEESALPPLSSPGSSSLPPLSPSSTVLRKALARSLSLLELIRVRTHDDASSHVVHAHYSQLWCVPEFKEVAVPRPMAPHVATNTPGAAEVAAAAAAAADNATTTKIVADFSDTAITAAPWRSLTGDMLDPDRLALFQRAVLSILLLHPGMTVAALSRHLPVLTPAELDELLNSLRLADKVSEQFRRVETPAALFSRMEDEEDEAEEEGQEEASRARRRRRKRRKLAAAAAVAEAAATAPTTQRYVFPTVRAFEP